MPAHAARFTRVRAAVVRATVCALVTGSALFAAAGPGSAATSSSVLGVYVPSATTIAMAGCPDATANVTEFGAVTPLSNTVTSLDCTVGFGSTNDSSQIRLAQADGGRDAMWRPTSGTLDTTFDTDGLADSGLEGYDSVRHPAGGWVSIGEDMGGSGWEFAAQRVDESGAPVWYAYRPIAGSADSMAFGATVDPGGRILLVGHTEPASLDFTIMRLEGDGDLDPTFNAGVTPGWNAVAKAGNQRFFAVGVQPSGRILAAGWNYGTNTAEVYGFTDAGVVDTTFGTAGVVTISFSADEEEAYDLAVFDDGRFLVTGTAKVGATYDVFVSRYGVDGALDTTYGAGGTRMIELDNTGPGYFQDPVQLVRNHVTGTTYVAATSRTAGNDDLMVAKLDDAGTLAPGFGAGAGRAYVDLSGANTDDDGFGVVAPDGDGVYALGMVNGTGIPKVVRLDTTTGALDPTFGTGGIWTAGSGTTNDQYLGKLAADRDGRIVAVAHSQVRRFATTTVPDYLPATSDWSTATGSFGACLRHITGGAQVDGTTWAIDGDGTPVDGGDCQATTGDAWNAVADDTTLGTSKLAMNPTSGNGAVSLRFGLRTSTGQAPGRYIAPLVFEVLAPNGP